MKTEASTNKVNEKNNSTVELLSEMYRNVTMGSENLVSVIPMIKDKFLLSNVTNRAFKIQVVSIPYGLTLLSNKGQYANI